MGFFQLEKKQFLQASPAEVWDFISSPANLKIITPEEMGFDIISENLPEKMYAGMIIVYRVKPLAGIPVTWVTEITQVKEKQFFIDEQRVGPYAFWHHQHQIEPCGDGVMMTDQISYKPPFGFLGSIANSLLIKRKLDTIFSYRESAMLKKFPSDNR
jgi:ligand-binding SRPBCC domain-containing protein